MGVQFAEKNRYVTLEWPLKDIIGFLKSCQSFEEKKKKKKKNIFI